MNGFSDGSSNRFFAPGGEFSRIERMFPPERFPADARGLGDDACLWEAGGETWAATSDASAEDVHYRLDWATPERALRKALLSNLSDINAMGGRARRALFNLGARRDWDDAVYARLGEALREMGARFGFEVCGGDIVRLPSSSFFSFAVLGVVEGRPLLRSACRPGQRVYVSGALGGSAAGLAALKAGAASAEGAPGFRVALGPGASALAAAHLDPEPPLGLGPALAVCASPVAAIDVSDGLSSELAHLARRSGCSLRVEADALPVHPALSGLPPMEARGFALHGGEEYQLLFTGAFSPEELARLRALAPVTEIGTVEAGEGVFLRDGGAWAPLAAKGWTHS